MAEAQLPAIRMAVFKMKPAEHSQAGMGAG